MTRISTGIEVPSTVSTSSAKISVGIAISASTARLRSWSSQPPTTAAVKPSAMPMVKESSVVASAMPMVSRAPKSRRERRSRPSWSVPSRWSVVNGAQTSPPRSPWP